MKILEMNEKDDKPADAPNGNDDKKRKYMNVLANNIVTIFALPDEEIPEVLYNVELEAGSPEVKGSQHFFVRQKIKNDINNEN